MAYRYGNREQVAMFPASIEEYVAGDDPVRAYDAFVDLLDFYELGISTGEVKPGSPQYDPKAMLKVLLYGYSYGIRSSRKLERALYHNVSFIWLAGGLKPDHKTISNFRRDNKNALKGIIKQCAKMCVKLGLIEGNTLFLDGTKVRGNASLSKMLTKEKAEKLLDKIEKRINAILDECENVDEKEAGSGSYVKMRKNLSDNEALKTKVEEVLKELDDGGRKSINITDPDCVNYISRQGNRSGYNAQVVVDDSNGLIVSSDVVRENNDLKQFSTQIEKAVETMGKECETACADAGYSSIKELKKVYDKGISVVVPTQRQVAKKPLSDFHKSKFKYDEERDLYICPEGKELELIGVRRERSEQKVYRAPRFICKSCDKFGICTKSKLGREIWRLAEEELREKLEKLYSSDDGQSLYNRRKQLVEHIFGHIKWNLGAWSFLLRGINGVRAEMSLLATCFNIRRMITILGVTKLAGLRT